MSQSIPNVAAATTDEREAWNVAPSTEIARNQSEEREKRQIGKFAPLPDEIRSNNGTNPSPADFLCGNGGWKSDFGLSTVTVPGIT